MERLSKILDLYFNGKYFMILRVIIFGSTLLLIIQQLKYINYVYFYNNTMINYIGRKYYYKLSTLVHCL
jgi:hypothetical protein